MKNIILLSAFYATIETITLISQCGTLRGKLFPTMVATMSPNPHTLLSWDCVTFPSKVDSNFPSLESELASGTCC